MEIQRKRRGKTLPSLIGKGELKQTNFDGYNACLRFIDQEGREVRVMLDRHEAIRFAEFVCKEVEHQRCRISDAIGAMQQLGLGGEDK